MTRTLCRQSEPPRAAPCDSRIRLDTGGKWILADAVIGTITALPGPEDLSALMAVLEPGGKRRP